MKDFIITIALLVFVIAILSLGLNEKMNKIRSKFCMAFFLLAILFAIYSVGYAGEQGAIGLIFVPFIILIPCIAVSIILFGIQFFSQKN